jgi:hypothetical protein
MYKPNIPIMYCIPAVFIQMWNNSKEKREGMKLGTGCHKNYAPVIKKLTEDSKLNEHNRQRKGTITCKQSMMVRDKKDGEGVLILCHIQCAMQSLHWRKT